MTTRSLAHNDARTVLMAVGMLSLSLAAFTLLYWSQNAGLLKTAYPVASLVIGVYLYAKHPPLFLGFVWTLWFVTPFVRRFIDYYAGYFDPSSLAMLTPYLVTGLTVITLLRFGGLLKEQAYRPFAYVLLGVLYGYSVGIVYQGAYEATIALLEWLIPILLGFHILVYWQEYPKYRQVLRGTFTWGVLLMGLYGIVQYIAPPGWDALWMDGSGMVSIGKPNPFEVRVFSTLNDPGHFALTMMAGLLLLFDGTRSIHRLAAVPGFIAFLLTSVRAAWGGWVVALTLIIMRLRGKLRARLIVIVTMSVVLSLPILQYEPFGARIGDRVETMGSITDDGSFQARLSLYEEGRALLTNPLGEGLGGKGVDSGVLSIPLVLGWPGSLLYFVGLLWLVKRVIRIRRHESDLFSTITGSVAVTLVISLIIANHVVGVKGAIMWAFLSIAIAAQVYYQGRAI